MSRALRVEFNGAFYHVTSRGNAQQDIYIESNDYLMFLDILGEVCQRYNWLIHSYCLMTNHYHLVIETPEGNLSLGMRQLNSVYTQRFNRKRGRCGHLFQGRFKSILVDSDKYYKTLIRYVMQNPVRAKIAKHPSDYSWSSYNPIIGKCIARKWLQVELVLKSFHEDRSTSLDLFQKFVTEHYESNFWNEVRHQVFLGDESFSKRYQPEQKNLSQVLEIPNTQKRRSAKPLAFYKETYQNRNKAIIEAFNTGSYTMVKIAKYLGIHYSTVSRIIARFKT